MSTWYVVPSGSNGDGSQGSPWTQSQLASNWASVLPGDLVVLIGAFSGQLSIGSSGEATNRLVIDARGATRDASGASYGFALASGSFARSYVDLLGGSVSGATLDNYTAFTGASVGLRLVGAASHAAGSDDFDFKQSTNLHLLDLLATAAANHGISLFECPNALIQRPQILACGTAGGNVDGLAINDGSGGTIVEDYEILGQLGGGSAVDCQNDTNTDPPIRLYRGRAIENAGEGAKIAGGDGGAAMYMGLEVVGAASGGGFYSYNINAGNFVAQATIVKTTVPSVRIGFTSNPGFVTLRNSILISPDATRTVRVINEEADDIDSDYNCMLDGAARFEWKGSNSDLAGWRTNSGGDAHSIPVASTAAVKFRDYTNNDLRLDTDSPCIGTGINWWDALDEPCPQGIDQLRFYDPPSKGSYELRPGKSGYARALGALPLRVLPIGVDGIRARDW